jgi:integrase
MASIKTYTTGKGDKRFCAEIVIRKNGKILHRESKTFKRATWANQWADQREAELKIHGIKGQGIELTIAELSAKYIEDYTGQVRMGRSKLADLKRLQTYPIAQIPASQLNSTHYIDHVRQRLKQAKPQTVNNDIVWIQTLLKFGIAAYKLEAKLEQIEVAKLFMRDTGLIARSAERKRIPTPDEHRRLIDYFERADRRRSLKMAEILRFAMYSARRLSEITRITWEDLSTEYSTILVRDLKHPRLKTGNHQKAVLPESALKIIKRQPVTTTQIFPFNPRTISTYFANACKILGIEDLHFHDYRHLATSWLFITGLGIEQVANITLHESWNVLKRYTHIDPETKSKIIEIYQIAI